VPERLGVRIKRFRVERDMTQDVLPGRRASVVYIWRISKAVISRHTIARRRSLCSSAWPAPSACQ
jgi:hypothetical protein